MEWADYLKFVQNMTRRVKSLSDQGSDENLKLLFDYSREVFNEERNIFRDLENKAAKYLTVFTLLLAAAGFFANWLGIKVLYPKDWWDMALLANGVTLLLTIFVSWLVIFLVLGIGDFEELPLDQRTIDFFLKTPIQEVYKQVPDGLKEAMKKNAKTSKAKAKLLKWGHRLIILTWILLLSFTTLFVLYKGRTGEVDQKKSDTIWQGLTIAEEGKQSIMLDIRYQGIYSLGAVCRQTTSKIKEPYYG